MNAVTDTQVNQAETGLYQKFIVNRTDGKDAPGGKHHGDKYFVLNLTTDKHAFPAIAAYAESCAVDYPLLANDLNALIRDRQANNNKFITVPEVTLPDGTVVPSFKVGQYHCSKGLGDIAVIDPDNKPWVSINYHEAREACKAAGYALLTELQALAIAHDIVNQDINWTGGKVGEGHVYMGLHKSRLGSAVAGNIESNDPEERRWHHLSNGERIYDVAGNLFTHVFDDVQGDENGIVAKKFAKDSPSITTAPYPSMEKGMGWRPAAGDNWSGDALVRGGYWSSESNAGVFRLDFWLPDYRNDSVGFRCTKSL